MSAKRFTFTLLLIALLLLAVAAVADPYCSLSVPCPIHDPQSGTFTGERRIIEGHWFGVYHCPGNGKPHEFLVRCL